MKMTAMKNKIVMVTGANSGIGKVTTREIAKMGATVVMVCRNMEKGQAVCDDINAEIGLERVHLLQADFAVHASIKSMSEAFKQKFDRLDILVNNAGGIKSSKKMTPDGFEWMFGVNHLGYFLTTHYLLDSLRAAENARVVNVSSLAHRFASLDWDNLNAEKGFRSFPTYGLSKLCNILFTKKLANYVLQDGITSNALHPGGVATNFGKGGSGLLSFIYETVGSKFMLSPEEGAATSIYLATSPDVEGVSGEYFVKKKKVFPSTLAMSSINAEKLWDISMQLTGIETFGKP
jgi:NAD(P)-dependent dehydrogenase (short-subunit alcohol dehydrogenase family)